MSNFVIALGGCGAKLLQSLIHLGAAGVLPAKRREIDAIIVDPDENNGNVLECKSVEESYQLCRSIQVGNTDLFSTSVRLERPWTPLHGSYSDTLKDLFQYNQPGGMGNTLDRDLLDLFFKRSELEMPLREGFRGRPAIAATVFAKYVDFNAPGGVWEKLKYRVKSCNPQGAKSLDAKILVAGSVFGGTGAAGIPIFVRLINENLGKESTMRLGLVLFLPFFRFEAIREETIQADPAGFIQASVAALNYYHQSGILDFCESTYLVGDKTPANVSTFAVGSADQRNDAHLVELIAGLGAVRFFRGQSHSSSLVVAARETDETLKWSDLPQDDDSDEIVRKLQKMVVFAVAYRYIFFPLTEKALSRRQQVPFWVDHVERNGLDHTEVSATLSNVFRYTETFLNWILSISTPQRDRFIPGLVDPRVFAVRRETNWRLKTAKEFVGAEFGNLILHPTGREKLDERTIYKRTSGMKVMDNAASGPGRLVRALYDACEVK